MTDLLDYALTTPARFSQFAGITTPASGSDKYNAMVNLINSVTSFIESQLGGRRIKLTTHTDEEYSTEESQTLQLKHFPVVTFTRLQRRDAVLNEDDWDTVDSSYYHVDNDSGVIYAASSLVFLRSRNGYRCTYSAGFDFDNSTTFLSDTAGGELELLAWILLQSVWTRRRGGFGIKSESIGDYRIEFSGALLRSSEAKEILDAWGDGGLDTFSYLTPLQE